MLLTRLRGLVLSEESQHLRMELVAQHLLAGSSIIGPTVQRGNSTSSTLAILATVRLRTLLGTKTPTLLDGFLRTAVW